MFLCWKPPGSPVMEHGKNNAFSQDLQRALKLREQQRNEKIKQSEARELKEQESWHSDPVRSAVDDVLSLPLTHAQRGERKPDMVYPRIPYCDQTRRLVLPPLPPVGQARFVRTNRQLVSSPPVNTLPPETLDVSSAVSVSKVSNQFKSFINPLFTIIEFKLFEFSS